VYLCYCLAMYSNGEFYCLFSVFKVRNIKEILQAYYGAWPIWQDSTDHNWIHTTILYEYYYIAQNIWIACNSFLCLILREPQLNFLFFKPNWSYSVQHKMFNHVITIQVVIIIALYTYFNSSHKVSHLIASY